MNGAIQYHSRVGDDGVLSMEIHLGRAEAKKEVVVTIRPLAAGQAAASENPLDWHEFVDNTYGSCAGLGLERPEQGQFEQREAIE
jgi:hypothetical protein